MVAMSELLVGKVGFIAGVRDRHSTGWGIAQALGAAGARLAVSYRQPRWERHVRALARTLPNALVVRMDATQDDEVARALATIDREYGGLDFIVHSIAGAPYDALHGRFVETTRADWHATMETNAYSLLAMARAAEPLFRRRGGGSVVAISYYGSEKAVLGYKVMGVAKAALESIVRALAAELGERNVRVNAISAGAMRTLSARGIPGFTQLYRAIPKKTPLRRNIATRDVGDTAAYLVSDLAQDVTGEIIHVDAGYHAIKS